MRQVVPHKNAPRILIVVPTGSNYFYDAIGRRFASAFRNIGCDVTACRLKDYQVAEYDLVLYSNLFEIGLMYVEGYPDASKVSRLMQRENHDLSEALPRIEIIQRHAQRSGVLISEYVWTKWFAHNYYLTQITGIGKLYDIGFHSQAAALNGTVDYCFLFNALTEFEQQRVSHAQLSEQEQTIPWAFVERISPQNLEFAHSLVRRMGSEGVIYLPEPITSDGSHFNAAQVRRLLEKTRYYIWTSHHNYFYMESERFRDALLAGCVPIKVQDGTLPAEAFNVPFSYLILNKADFDEHLQMLDYAKLRQRFVKDYLAKPSLETLLAQEMLSVQMSRQLQALT